MQLRLVTTSVLLALTISLGAQTTCTGHFVNRSNYQWSIAGYAGPQSKLMVPPGTTVDIPYGTPTSVTVSGYIPNRPYTKQFQLQPANGCFIILYTGNPGYISINKPNSGDVVTCAGGC